MGQYESVSESEPVRPPSRPQSPMDVQNEVKLVLLGTNEMVFFLTCYKGSGESGKTTLAKQLIKLYKDSFSWESKAIRARSYLNALDAICFLIKDQPKVAPDLPIQNQFAKNLVLKMREQIAMENPQLVYTEESVAAMRHLYLMEPGIAETVKNSHLLVEYHEATEYWIQNLDRLLQPEYTPSWEDVLCQKMRTLGGVETTFMHMGTRFKIADVGGFKSERKKWPHFLSNLTATVCCSLLVTLRFLSFHWLNMI